MQKLILASIRFYQRYIASRPSVCRYNPTCSEYTYQSITKYGILRGSIMGLKQLLTCHPWHHV